MTDLLETKARRFLESISAEGAGSLEALGGPKTQLEAMLPKGAVRPEMQNLVEKTAEKIIAREQLNQPEQFALEAIIIPDKRPPVVIANGDYKVEHPLWLHLNEDSARKKIRPALPSIGRIELPGHPSYPFGGTGFVVGDGMLMTNRHVAEIFCGGLGNRGLVFRPGHRAGIDFKREVTGGSLYFEVVEVLLIHPYWDMALLRVEGLSDTIVPLSLSLRTPAEVKDNEVVVIGYPAFDPRNNASVQNEVFGGIYDVKRLMPGKLTGEAAVASFGKSVPSAKHDSSTLGGASGSAVIVVETGEVVALHFSGVYLESNYGVPAAALACDNRITDLGLNFSGTPEGRSGPWDEWWRIAGSEAAGVTVAVADQPKAVPAAGVPAGGASASFTIPIEIEVKVGAPASTAGAGAAASGAADAVIERAVQPVHDEDYSSRRGYDADFLSVSVPLPEVTDADAVATLEDGEHVIPYFHFSVVMHRDRRMALFTAANVDADPARKQPVAGKRYTRDALGGLGENDREQWFTDPRLRGIDQLPDRFFEKDNKAFDKGHLVRREDVAWGTTYDEVQLANGDTFHTTNCSPQVAGFNRSNHKDNWGALEDVVLKQASDQKLTVFSGPVLSAGDRRFVGVDEASKVRIQIPEAYWKVVVAVDEGELRTFAFLLRQNLSATPLEFAVTPAWEQKMVALSELEEMIGIVRFPKVVHDSDQKGRDAGTIVERVTIVG